MLVKFSCKERNSKTRLWLLFPFSSSFSGCCCCQNSLKSALRQSLASTSDLAKQLSSLLCSLKLEARIAACQTRKLMWREWNARALLSSSLFLDCTLEARRSGWDWAAFVLKCFPDFDFSLSGRKQFSFFYDVKRVGFKIKFCNQKERKKERAVSWHRS